MIYILSITLMVFSILCWVHKSKHHAVNRKAFASALTLLWVFVILKLGYVNQTLIALLIGGAMICTSEIIYRYWHCNNGHILLAIPIAPIYIMIEHAVYRGDIQAGGFFIFCILLADMILEALFHKISKALLINAAGIACGIGIYVLPNL